MDIILKANNMKVVTHSHHSALLNFIRTYISQNTSFFAL